MCLRASQINGCSVCLDIHTRAARKAGETDERLSTLAGRRDASYCTEPERSALALAEAATRLADRTDAVPDDIWERAARHYDEPALSALVAHIAAINTWTRLDPALFLRPDLSVRTAAARRRTRSASRITSIPAILPPRQ